MLSRPYRAWGSEEELRLRSPFRLAIEPWPLALIIDRATGAESGATVPLFDSMSSEMFVIVTELRAALFAHVQRLSLSWHHRARSGDLLARLTADIGRLQDVSVTAALPLFGHALAMVGMVAVMLVLNWSLGLLTLLAVPGFVLISRRRWRRICAVSRKQRRIEGALAASASEVFGAISVAQANSLEQAMGETFAQSNRHSLRDGVKAKRLAADLE